MKSLTEYINEGLKLGKGSRYKYYPETKEELKEIIEERIKEEGYECDLNDICTSKITDMSKLFGGGGFGQKSVGHNFNGDISKWDVSKVTNMREMFAHSNFNGDLSKWNVSNVTDMNNMFSFAKFTGENGNIDKWDVSNVTNMCEMFWHSNFNSDISKWDVSNVTDMENMFKYSKIDCDLSGWKLNKNCKSVFLFSDSAFANNPEKWPQGYKGI